MYIPYILESNPHPFYSCRGLKMQMLIRIECGLDSQSRAGVWPNDRAGVRAVRTIQGGKNEVLIRFENIRYMGSPVLQVQVLSPSYLSTVLFFTYLVVFCIVQCMYVGTELSFVG
jgi:hypothetical protein